LLIRVINGDLGSKSRMSDSPLSSNVWVTTLYYSTTQ